MLNLSKHKTKPTNTKLTKCTSSNTKICNTK